MVTEKETEQTNEFSATREELEGLKQTNEALNQELKAREANISRLEQALSEKDSQVAALNQAVAEAQGKLTEVNEALAQAVASYKAMIIKSSPGVIAELITGNTVAEVDESLKNAQALIEKVRQEMEAETSKTKVPAGAPQRAPLDLSALSPREKIQYAIGGNK